MPKTITEISNTTNMDLSNLSKNLKTLEELKLINIKNKNLKKGKLITLTDKGKQLIYDLKGD